MNFGPLRALERVGICVRAGELVALAGENGAGKSTLVRCLAGDLVPDSGTVWLDGRPLDPHRKRPQGGVAVVWQDLALCDNLDVAANLLLGAETTRLMLSDARFHAAAATLLEQLGIELPATTTKVANLSGGQRQLVAVARAMRERPRVLILDEPTAALGVAESARVEELAKALPASGTAVVMVTHDVDQMFRLATRIVVMRKGRVVAEVDPSRSHPDEVAALLAGQPLDLSARRQLDRLQTLTGALAEAEPSSSLALIMSALSAALGIEHLCVHLSMPEDRSEGPIEVLGLAGSVGLHPALAAAWKTVRPGSLGSQVLACAQSGRVIICSELERSPLWRHDRALARQAGLRSAWSVPFSAPGGGRGVISVFGSERGAPSKDQVDLVGLYAGYVASALERDRLLGEVTKRNSALETIRDVLQTLAGPMALSGGLDTALARLREGLGAAEVGLFVEGERGSGSPRAWVTPGPDPSTDLWLAAEAVLGSPPEEPGEPPTQGGGPRLSRGLPVVALRGRGGGSAVLVARVEGAIGADKEALLEDAAHSLRLALEREESERAQREALALRSSQELQRKFLSWASHELRTPLTAIRGYASSLLAPDVDWDGPSVTRFLQRISEESARLGRLVEDLLDFSTIDAGLLRLAKDWCELALVINAACECLPEASASAVSVSCPQGLPQLWADHERLEQVFVNLLDNALVHNPPGTKVTVEAEAVGEAWVRVRIIDDGPGMEPPRLPQRPRTMRPSPGRRGAGLGLSITKGIVEAHGGAMRLASGPGGTVVTLELPVAEGAPAEAGADPIHSGSEEEPWMS